MSLTQTVMVFKQKMIVMIIKIMMQIVRITTEEGGGDSIQMKHLKVMLIVVDLTENDCIEELINDADCDGSLQKKIVMTMTKLGKYK